MEMEYLQLRNNDVVPALDHLRPFKCVLLIDSDFSTAWQKKISERLVKSGCYYLMPWGKNASSWNDAIDSALLAQFNYQAIPAESSIMTLGMIMAQPWIYLHFVKAWRNMKCSS